MFMLKQIQCIISQKTSILPFDVAVFSKIVIESLDSSGSFEVSEHLDLTIRLLIKLLKREKMKFY